MVTLQRFCLFSLDILCAALVGTDWRGGLCFGQLGAYIPPMSPAGSIIIQAECACGHRAVLTAERLGEAPDYFMGFDRLRCSRCGRRGRPVSVIRYWSSAATKVPDAKPQS